MARKGNLKVDSLDIIYKTYKYPGSNGRLGAL